MSNEETENENEEMDGNIGEGEGEDEAKREIFSYYMELKNELFPESKPKPEITFSSMSTQTIINYIKEYTEMFITQKINENEEMKLETLNQNNNILLNENNYKEIVNQLESHIRKLEYDIRYYMKREFQNKITKDSLEIKLTRYMMMEEEYEFLKEKVKYDEGKFLNNERKDNEILILRQENSNLKREITDLENEKNLNDKKNEKKINELIDKLKKSEQTISKLKASKKESNNIKNNNSSINININNNGAASSKFIFGQEAGNNSTSNNNINGNMMNSNNINNNTNNNCCNLNKSSHKQLNSFTSIFAHGGGGQSSSRLGGKEGVNINMNSMNVKVNGSSRDKEKENNSKINQLKEIYNYNSKKSDSSSNNHNHLGNNNNRNNYLNNNHGGNSKKKITKIRKISTMIDSNLISTTFNKSKGDKKYKNSTNVISSLGNNNNNNGSNNHGNNNNNQNNSNNNSNNRSMNNINKIKIKANSKAKEKSKRNSSKKENKSYYRNHWRNNSTTMRMEDDDKNEMVTKYLSNYGIKYQTGIRGGYFNKIMNMMPSARFPKSTKEQFGKNGNLSSSKKNKTKDLRNFNNYSSLNIKGSATKDY